MPRPSFNTDQEKVIVELYLGGKTTKQIAHQYGVYPQSVLNALKRRGIDRRKTWARASGPNNGAWRGGIRMIKGYRHRFIPSHPLARADGWVAVHRFLMADKITKKKQVDQHKDGNRINNDKLNLKVMKDNGAHRREHSKTQPRGYKGRFI